MTVENLNEWIKATQKLEKLKFAFKTPKTLLKRFTVILGRVPMDILIWDHYDFFASNIMCDVCAYFLQTLYNDEKEYSTRRGSLYSEYGKKTLIQCLNDLPLDFFMELKYDATLRKIPNLAFDRKVSTIIERSEWTTRVHSIFYENCAKIVILGIVAMDFGYLNKAKIHNEIVKMAKQAYEIYKLDVNYDMARKTAHSIFYTVFRMLGTDIREFITPVEQEIGGFEEFIFPEGFINWIIVTEQNTKNVLSKTKNFKVMDGNKFHFLVKGMLDEYKRTRNETDINEPAPNAFLKFLVVAVKVGTISLYCVRNSFAAGVQQGIDTVVELVLMVKRLSFFTFPTQ